ncbi:MAG: tetratricopeptide repeat protein [Candidatus Caenarcaniphilales bacterium]|nr:tetratricopeptide repeat protein [Candidatus Caenarcaniphilales bacterium]
MDKRFKVFIISTTFCIGVCSIPVASEINKDSVNYYSLALNWQRKGNITKAEEAFHKAVELSPGDGDLRGNYAKALIKNQKIKQGLNQFKKAISLSPREARLRVLYGQSLMKVKKTSEAINQFKVATELEPNYPLIFLNLGEAQQIAGLYGESLISLNKALSDDPENLHIISLIATAHHKTNKLDKAVANYQKVLSYSANNEWARLNLARAYYSIGDLNSSEKEYVRLLNNRPKDPELLASLADVKFKQGELVTSINLLNRAISVQDNDPSLYSMIAYYYDKAGNLDLALKHFELAYEKEKEEKKKRSYLISKAQILYKKGKYNDSALIVEDILRQEPDNLSIKTQLADIRLWQKKYKKAVSLYREALIINPQLSSNENIIFNYGAALSGLKDWSNAEIVWNNYIKLKNNNKDAWFNLANVKSALGKFQEAINSYRQAKFYGYSQVSTLEKIVAIQAKTNQLQDAEYTYRELIKLKPNKDKYKVAIAHNLDQQGRENESIEFLQYSHSVPARLELAKRITQSGDHYSASTIYQSILNLEPDNKKALIGLADCYSAIGQFEESSKLYKKVLTIDSLNFHAQYNYASSLANQGEETMAITEYKKAIVLNATYVDSYYALGSILLNKDVEKARYYWRKYVELAPEGEYINDIFHHFPDLGSINLKASESPY